MMKYCLNPRLNCYFEMYAGTSGFSFLQNIVDGSQPIAVFNSLGKSVELFGDLDIPNFYNKTEIDAIGDELSALIKHIYENRSKYIIIEYQFNWFRKHRYN